MIESPLSPLLSSPILVYGLFLSLVIGQLFALLLIPCLLQGSSKPTAIIHAIYCYLMQAVGVFLMTMGAVPTFMMVVSGEKIIDGQTYVVFLIIFLSGGALFLVHDAIARTIDAVSRQIPHLLYLYLFKTLGILTSVLSFLSLLILIILNATDVTSWWVSSLVLLTYGLILVWCTRGAGHRVGLFRINPMHAPSPMKAGPVLLASAKSATPRRKAEKRRK